METPKKTLLDLDHNPTLEELRAFFRENDFSAAEYMNLNYEEITDEAVTFLEYAKNIIDEHWKSLSREMGLKSHSSYYGEAHPLIAMRDNFENLVSAGVYKLIVEQPEKAAELLEDFTDDNGEFNGDADRLLHNAVETAMKTMSYEETAKIIKDAPAYEDFNHRKHNNYRAMDFNRKWNHTRAKTEIISMTEFGDISNARKNFSGLESDVTEETLINIKQGAFWAGISEDDKKLLLLRIDGLTHEEIAKELGYKTHSAVTKRLQKLKKIFENCT